MHPEIELLISDGQDKTEKQVADVENFIRQGVDVLLISPKESAGLTGVTLEGNRSRHSCGCARPEREYRQVHPVHWRR